MDPRRPESGTVKAGGQIELAARLADHVCVLGVADSQGPAGAEHACCSVAIVVLVVLLVA